VMLTPFKQDGAIDWPGVDALTDWYIDAGVAGLFSVCLSSEMYHLTEDERLTLAKHVVDRSAGRVPVVASGTFGGSTEGQADFVKCMYDAGVDGVVVLACQLVGADDSEDAWRKQAEQLLSLTGEIPLGLYECPSPYHRVLSSNLIGWCASTGRFLFTKDTSCRMDWIAPKAEAVRDSSLRFFNANTPTLLASLKVGGDGYCGTAANFYPELFVWLCDNFRNAPELAEKVQQFLSVANPLAAHKYKTSAKLFLSMLGLPIEPVCRDSEVTFRDDELTMLRHLRGMVQAQREMLGLQGV